VICEIRPAPGAWSVTTAVVDVVDVVATLVVDTVATVGVVVGTEVVVVGTVVVGLGVMAQEDSAPPSQLHCPARHSAGMLFRHCRRALRCSPAQRVFIAARQWCGVHLFFAASPVETRAASPSAIASPSLLMIAASSGCP
jgi:hypothetical protein